MPFRFRHCSNWLSSPPHPFSTHIYPHRCVTPAKIGSALSIASSVLGTKPAWSQLDDSRKMAAKQAAEKLISEHLVAVFSKSYCPYCSQAKSVIDKLGLDKSKVGILELDTMGSEGSDIQVRTDIKVG